MSDQRKWVMIVAALVVQAVIWGIGLSTFTLWAGAWISGFGASHAEIMAAIMLTHVATGLLAPAAARLAETVPLRLLIASGTFLFAGSLAAVSAAGAMWQICLLYALPLAMGMVITGPLVGQILAVRLFRERPGLAIGVVTLGLSLGGFAMPPIAAFVLSQHPWRESMLVLAAATAVLLLPLVLLVLREPQARLAASTVSSHTSLALPSGVILRDRVFWGAVLIVTSLTLFFNGIYYNLGPWMTDMGYTREQTAVLISLVAVAATVGILGAGALVDRVDPRLLLLVALFCNGGAMIAAATGARYGELLVAMPALGLATGGMIPLLAAVMAQRFGTASFARANGLSLVFVPLAIAGALLAGFGRDLLGSYPAAFRMLLAALVPCALGFILLNGAQRSRAAVLEQERA